MNTKLMFLIWLLAGMTALAPCHAQNRIDKLVENFSTLGSAKFTSVVDRDPKTGQVQKVVKELRLVKKDIKNTRSHIFQACMIEPDITSKKQVITLINSFI